MSEDSNSTELAYQLAIESYKMAQERYIQANNGIMALMTMATQVFLFFPIIVGTVDLDVEMRFVSHAGSAFLTIIGYGITARFFCGRFTVIRPRQLHKNSEPALDFMQSVIDSVDQILDQTFEPLPHFFRRFFLKSISVILFFEIVFLLLALLVPVFTPTFSAPIPYQLLYE